MLSSQTRREKLVTSIKYLEFQVQKLINLNCVTKFRYLGQYSSFSLKANANYKVTVACKEVVLNMMFVSDLDRARSWSSCQV